MIPHHNFYNVLTFTRFNASSLFTVSYTLISQQISKQWRFNSTRSNNNMSNTLSSYVYVSFNWCIIKIFFIVGSYTKYRKYINKSRKITHLTKSIYCCKYIVCTNKEEPLLIITLPGVEDFTIKRLYWNSLHTHLTSRSINKSLKT